MESTLQQNVEFLTQTATKVNATIKAITSGLTANPSEPLPALDNGKLRTYQGCLEDLKKLYATVEVIMAGIESYINTGDIVLCNKAGTNLSELDMSNWNTGFVFREIAYRYKNEVTLKEINSKLDKIRSGETPMIDMAINVDTPMNNAAASSSEPLVSAKMEAKGPKKTKKEKPEKPNKANSQGNVPENTRVFMLRDEMLSLAKTEHTTPTDDIIAQVTKSGYADAVLKPAVIPTSPIRNGETPFSKYSMTCCGLLNTGGFNSVRLNIGSSNQKNAIPYIISPNPVLPERMNVQSVVCSVHLEEGCKRPHCTFNHSDGARMVHPSITIFDSTEYVKESSGKNRARINFYGDIKTMADQLTACDMDGMGFVLSVVWTFVKGLILDYIKSGKITELETKLAGMGINWFTVTRQDKPPMYMKPETGPGTSSAAHPEICMAWIDDSINNNDDTQPMVNMWFCGVRFEILVDTQSEFSGTDYRSIHFAYEKPTGTEDAEFPLISNMFMENARKATPNDIINTLSMVARMFAQYMAIAGVMNGGRIKNKFTELLAMRNKLTLNSTKYSSRQ